MENNIEIFIMSDSDTMREFLGYEEDESVSQDVIEIEQGLSVDTIEIEEDGTFEIPEGYHGQIESEQEFFQLVQIDEDYFEKEPLSRIEPGHYQIEDDTIKKLDENQFHSRF